MCGIYGIVGSRSIPLLDAMGKALSHRGPDEQGRYLGDGVALGIRRLSIVDPAGGQQPVSNENETLHTVFNGEIYNHKALRESLTAKGHRFRSQTDSEVVVHAYEEYGVECCNHFDGMFAFAVWDQQREQLCLARDRAGEKPLFYCRQGQQFVFASEIKAILQASELSRGLNVNALDNYLSRLYVPGEETMFEGIQRLEPGHSLLWRHGELQLRRYWDLRFSPHDRRGETEQAGDLSMHLEQAVTTRLAPEGPTGVFLSGGLDSSAVLALARKSGADLRSYAMGFEAAESRVVDERNFAAQVAAHFETPHTEVVISGEQVRDALPKILWHFDEPFSGAVPQYFLSQPVSADTKVVLSGLGGDELFGNYGRRFRLQRALGYWGPLWDYLPRSLRPEGALSETYAEWFGAFNSEQRRRLLRTPVREKLNPSKTTSAILAGYLAGSQARQLGDQVFLMDFKTQLVSEYLAYADILSMAWGVECRAPFLSHPLVEFAAKLPPAQRNRRTEDKYLLRKVCAGFLPGWVLERKKAGFTLPYAAWLRGALREMVGAYLQSDRLKREGFFEVSFVQGLLKEFYTDGRNELAYSIWALLCFEIWYEVVFLGPRISFSEAAPPGHLAPAIR